MAALIRMLLPLLCALLAQGHFVHQESSQFSSSQQQLPLSSDNVDVRTYPLNPDLGTSPSVPDRPINGDVFSYNTHHFYDDYYRDGNYNPGVYPYYRYPSGSFDDNNYDNMPFGFPSVNPGYNIHSFNPGNGNGNGNGINNNKPNEKPVDNNNPSSKNDEGKKDKHDDHQQPADQKDKDKSTLIDKQSDNSQSKPDNNNGDVNKKDNVALQAKKDFLLVGNGGNNYYLLHENTPNANPIVVPNANPPLGNVVYVPYNPQQNGGQLYQVVSGTPPVAPKPATPVYQVVSTPPISTKPGTPVYQVVSGLPPVTSNVPMTANRLNVNQYNNVLPNPPPTNVPVANKPSYVLIYANGQLIQIPGYVVNSAPNLGSNVVVPNGVPPQKVMYVNQPNQGNVQVPNGVAPNPSYVVNPVATPNNNPTTYVVSQQNPVSQPAVPAPQNIPNGYVQPNAVNQPAAIPANANQGIQPAYALPINNQVAPAQEKEENVTPAPNNVPASVPQVVTQAPAQVNNAGNNLGIQPAVMLSGFKESDTKDNRKENKNDKEIKKNKDDAKKKVSGK